TWTLLYTRRLLPLLLRTVVTGLLVPVIVDILWGCSRYDPIRNFLRNAAVKTKGPDKFQETEN
ncbi:hypothetical protein, partial [Faecalibacterium sp. An192]|uniref:hypothetical protein n=1 Tax=Faecalibacterium sp. An192 TaxID=1965581 RepID=UPI0019D03E40